MKAPPEKNAIFHYTCCKIIKKDIGKVVFHSTCCKINKKIAKQQYFVILVAKDDPERTTTKLFILVAKDELRNGKNDISLLNPTQKTTFFRY